MRTPPPLALPFFPAVFSVKMRRSARGFNQKSLADRTSAEVFLSYHEHGQDARPLAPGKRGFSPGGRGGGGKGVVGKARWARRGTPGVPRLFLSFPHQPPKGAGKASLSRRQRHIHPCPLTADSSIFSQIRFQSQSHILLLRRVVLPHEPHHVNLHPLLHFLVPDGILLLRILL